MTECSFLGNSGTLISEMWKLSSKYKFLKTHLHQDVRISFQNGSIWERSVTAKTGNEQTLVSKSEGRRNTFIKNRQLLSIFLISCKAISLANLFFIKKYKIESRRCSWHKWSRKCGSKREKVIGVMAIIMISKMIFWNKEAVRTKITKTYKKSKKLPKKRAFWQFGIKSQGYTNFYFGFKN